MRFHFRFRQVHHGLDKVFQQGNCCFFIECFSQLLSSVEIFREGALIEQFYEHFDAFVVFDVFEDFYCVDFFLFVVSVEIYFVQEVLVKLLLVAIFAEVDVFEFCHSEFAQPGQTVLLVERTLLFSTAFENPKLVVFLNIFLFFGVGPAVIANQSSNTFAVSDAFTNLIGVVRHHTVFFLDQ